jgi:RNA polymerase sigma-70 factor (ECF subfamily)
MVGLMIDLSESAPKPRRRRGMAVARDTVRPLDGAMKTAQDDVGVPASHDDLIEAIARRRDKTAFAELFAHFAPRLKSYLMRLGSDDSSAEEIVQEALVMVWRKAESFDRRQASASTWIFTIARNKRIDRLRRDRRPELDPNDPALVPDPEEQADRTVEASQTRTRIQAAMEKLPTEQSDLIRLAYFDDKSHAEIAAETNLPLGTVKSRIRLALGRLRREVEDLDD